MCCVLFCSVWTIVLSKLVWFIYLQDCNIGTWAIRILRDPYAHISWDALHSLIHLIDILLKGSEVRFRCSDNHQNGRRDLANYRVTSRVTDSKSQITPSYRELMASYIFQLTVLRLFNYLRLVLLPSPPFRKCPYRCNLSFHNFNSISIGQITKIA